MKYAFLIGDGMSDRPVAELSGKTPIEAARTPNMDRVASAGILGLINNYSGKNFGMNSDVCIMSLLGYSPKTYYTGRGPLEAFSMGVDIKPNHVVFRCNLASVSDNILIDYSSGHISTKEAAILIGALNESFSGEGIVFYPGMSYRHIAVFESDHDNFAGIDLEKIKTNPPHDVVNNNLDKVFPAGKGGKVLCEIMRRTYDILENHEVNHVRKNLNETPANIAWLWGQGRPPSFSKFPVRGAAISAVDVVKGIAGCAGLDVVNVPGATGYFDTDYSAKAGTAISLFNKYDFVLVHVEAPDEAGHTGNLYEKIRAIENFDSKVVGPVLNFLEKTGDYRLVVLPDHSTPLAEKKHAADPIPFAMCGSDIHEASGLLYNEKYAKKTGVFIGSGDKLIEMFLNKG